ncbi:MULTISPECIES: hypothetical protein [unclassified Moorena]|nr:MULTISPECIES: hypothetical protein [unclassified Moorena]
MQSLMGETPKTALHRSLNSRQASNCLWFSVYCLFEFYGHGWNQ